MSKKSRADRFDEVFQMIIIIEAILLEFMWTFLSATIVSVIVFIEVLVFWIWGTLQGGTWEYPIKLAGVWASIYVFFIWFLRSIWRTTIDLRLLYLAIGILFPIISLLISLGVLAYLGEIIDRKRTLTLLIGPTVIALEFFSVVFLIDASLLLQL